MPHVLVGLSGGVDSALAAALLQAQGYRVTAAFMKNWQETDSQGYCPQAQDLADAQWVADKLNIPLHVLDFSAAYWEEVFAHFLRELQAGRTPNPDIGCNRFIKFAWLKDHAQAIGADYLATGHYARILPDPITRTSGLYRAANPHKDQSYFLHSLTHSQLDRVLFPLGDWPDKEAVRQAAAARGLPVHAKKDSTGICFIGERKFADFLKQYLPTEPGPIRNENGQTMGTHQGLAFYTIGQRKGLHIGGMQQGNGKPWYVAHKDKTNNCLIVVQDPEHPLLWTRSVAIEPLHWIASRAPTPGKLHCQAQIRYRQTAQPGVLEPLSNGKGFRMLFDTAQRAVTPGQYCVIFQGEQCLGGGPIANSVSNVQLP